MARGKVKLSYIQNNIARKKSLEKRIPGLLKKAHELSTLCGVDVCAIVYDPNNPVPKAWPSQLGAEHVIRRFKDMSAYAHSKYMKNPDTFSKQLVLNIIFKTYIINLFYMIDT